MDDHEEDKRRKYIKMPTKKINIISETKEQNVP